MDRTGIFRHFNKKWYPLIAFLLTLLSVMLAFSMAQMLSNGRYTMLYGDYMQQYVPFARLFAEDIKKGNFSGYTWNVALGQGTSMLYPFYCMSPFNFLFLLFPDDIIAAEWVVLLRISAAAFTCCLFLQNGRKEEGIRSIFFSVCYAMSSFGIVFFHVNDGVWLLPLILLLIHRFHESHKITELVLAYTSSFIIFFYAGYIVGIFSFLYYMGILWYRDGRHFIRENIREIAVYFAGVATAVLLSMCVLYPALLYYLDNPIIAEEINGGINLLPTDIFYALFMGQPFELYLNIPYLYCGLPVLLLLPLYFMNRKIDRKERLISGAVLLLLLSAIYIRPLYLALHLFNYPDGYTVRYAYVIVMLLVVIACRQSRYLKDIKLKLIFRIAGIDILLYFAACWMNQKIFQLGTASVTAGTGTANIIFTFCWCFWLYIFSLEKVDKASKVSLAMLLIMAECGLNAFWLGNGMETVSEDKYRAWQADATDALAEISREDTGIYRLEFSYNYLYNQQAQLGYMGAPVFSTIRNGGLDRFMYFMGDDVLSGYSQKGANDVTDMLLGVKYYIEQQEYDLNNPVRAFTDYKQMEHVLEMGYMVDGDVLENVSFTSDVFDNQNKLLGMMTGEDIAVYREAPEAEIMAEGVIWQTEGDRAVFEKAAGTDVGVLGFYIPVKEYGKAYAYFSQRGATQEDGGLSGNVLNKNIIGISTNVYSCGIDRHPNQTSYGLYRPAIIEMEQQGDGFVVWLLDYNEAGLQSSYEKLYLYYQDEEELDRAYGMLSGNQWEIEEFADGYIRAWIEVPADKNVLFMSIPYDRGWELKVDGKPQELVGLFENALLGTSLTEGRHEIVLMYRPRGRVEGWIMTGAGLFLWIFAVLLSRRYFCFQAGKDLL